MRPIAFPFLLALMLNAAAGEAPQSESEIQKFMRTKLERKISVEFEDTPVHEALTFIISLTGLNVISDPGQESSVKNISLKVKEKSLADALDQILDKAGLEYQIGNTAMYIVKKGSPKREDVAPFSPVADWEKAFVQKLQKKVTAEFVDTPLDEAVVLLRALGNVNIFLDSSLSKQSAVNWKFKDQTLEVVLTEILRLQDLNYQFFHDGLLIRKNNIKRGEDLKPFAPVSETEKEITKKLQRKVSFQFVDTPLTEALNFLTSLTKCNILLDPECDNNAVTLQVSDMNMESALLWIMLFSETRYVLRDDAIYIAPRELLAAKPPAPLTPEQTAAFKKAAAELGGEDFEARENASKALRALGPGALPLLEAELKAAKDAETSARISALIESFPRGANFSEDPEVTKLLADEKFSRKVSIDYVDTALAECVRFLNVSCNLGMEWDHAAEKKLTLRVVDMEARNTLRWIVRLGGAKMSVENGKIKIAPRSGK